MGVRNFPPVTVKKGLTWKTAEPPRRRLAGGCRDRGPRREKAGSVVSWGWGFGAGEERGSLTDNKEVWLEQTLEGGVVVGVIKPGEEEENSEQSGRPGGAEGTDAWGDVLFAWRDQLQSHQELRLCPGGCRDQTCRVWDRTNAVRSRWWKVPPPRSTLGGGGLEQG